MTDEPDDASALDVRNALAVARWRQLRAVAGTLPDLRDAAATRRAKDLHGRARSLSGYARALREAALARAAAARARRFCQVIPFPRRSRSTWRD